MKRFLITLVVISSISMVRAQEHSWAFGFYGDVQLKDTGYGGSFGAQGKYDFNNHHSLQAQVHGRSSYVSVGTDYLLSVFNKQKKSFNIYLGGGVSQEFYSYSNDAEVGTIHLQDDSFVGNVQAGLTYYFAPVKLSVYTGYKAKYAFSMERFDADYLQFGVRYHLW